MDDRISVFLVDDHAVVREGLTAILSREPDIHVVGEAADAETALRLMEEVRPAVVVLDFRLPGVSGVEICREIAERRLPSQVVILSAFLERAAVEGALRAGARAYVVKDVEADELLRAIRAAAEGKTTIDPKVPAGYGLAREEKLFPKRLFPILAGLSEGQSASAIAETHGLSPHTVRGYLRELYATLGVNSRAQAIAVAARRGLI